MQVFTQLINYIFIIGAAQGALLAVSLFKKQENQTANRILGFTILTFVVDLLMALYYNSKMYFTFPHLVGLSSGFPYMYGPSIYLYVMVLGHKREGFKRSYILHYVPFIFVYLATIFIFSTATAEFKIGLIESSFEPPWYISIVGRIIPLHGAAYALLTIQAARNFNRSLKGSYSNIEKLKISWLSFLAVGAGVVWLVVILSYIFDALAGDRSQGFIFIYIAISILVYTIGYKSLRQPDIQVDEVIAADVIAKETAESYKKSGLQESVAEQCLTQLLALMTEKKPYLNNNIRLSDLADMLGVSTHNLSEILNAKLNENFYDFINKYRVEEVKRLIQSGEAEKFNLLSLGYEAGFSSKSAYYAAFKKATGLTPAKYRESL